VNSAMKIVIEIVKMIKDVCLKRDLKDCNLLAAMQIPLKVVAEAIDKMKATLSTVLGRLREY
jgi:hypothetical protein